MAEDDGVSFLKILQDRMPSNGGTGRVASTAPRAPRLETGCWIQRITTLNIDLSIGAKGQL